MNSSTLITSDSHVPEAAGMVEQCPLKVCSAVRLQRMNHLQSDSHPTKRGKGLDSAGIVALKLRGWTELPQTPRVVSEQALGEEHYTVDELAEMLKVHPTTVSRWLQPCAHLIPDAARKRRSRYGPIKLHKAHFRIPKSVTERMHRDMMGKDSTE